MEILGVGPLELLFIFLIALIVLGPNDMVKAGRTLGRFLRKIVTSPTWQTIQQTSRDIRYLPNRLMREAGIDELEQQMKSSLPDAQQLRRDLNPGDLTRDLGSISADLSAWTTPPSTVLDSPPPPQTPESPSLDPRPAQASEPPASEPPASEPQASEPPSTPPSSDSPSEPHHT